MNLLFRISAQEIQDMKSYFHRARTDPNVGLKELHSGELCYGTIVLCEGKHTGKVLILPRVPLFLFFHGMQTFLTHSKKADSAIEQLSDMYQSFHVALVKDKNVFHVRATEDGQDIDLQFDFRKFRNHVDYVVQQFFDDVLYFCPEVRLYHEALWLHKMFPGVF